MPRPKQDSALVETGIYGVIRHPLYLAVFTTGLGWAVATASAPAALAAALLGLWLDAKARREEHWLTDAFPGYAAYRGRTHRFIPGIY
jgi:protein-S-isoprenylcysteine O-methyltransferase Ste14